MINYETTFENDFSAALKDFARRVNDDKTRGSRQRAAAELRVPGSKIQNWMDGRTCPDEASFRRLMSLLSQQINPENQSS